MMDEITIYGHPFQRMQKGMYECHMDDVLLDVMKMSDGFLLWIRNQLYRIFLRKLKNNKKTNSFCTVGFLIMPFELFEFQECVRRGQAGLGPSH